MGVMDMIKGQFLDVIEYVDTNGKILVKKYDRGGDDEIKEGSQVIVREGQAAAFIKGGNLADVMEPGTYILNTDNFPFLSKMQAFSFGFRSPVIADLYFISLKQFVGNKWEMANPIIVRDKDLNMARITAFGKFSFRVIDVTRFVREIIGAQSRTMTFEIIKYLESILLEAAAVAIAECNMSILDLAVKYRSLSDTIMQMANEKALAFGIAFSEVILENLSLPDEVEEMIDEQSGIGMAGRDMNTFMQYQTARAMRDASRQEGGMAGLGAGMALGNTLAQNLSAVQPQAQPQQAAAQNAQNAGEQKEKSNIEQIREFKQLLDEGIITQEEFNLKKKQLLGL
ncbi:SPFH domain-containing protein [Diplocloster agilis]|nr:MULTISPECIES: SPFH domain-containing protein [Lachnospiraceae]MCU6732975.1 SPFH domain-containing protein [Suonthocola fibrivorans]SCI71131.1 Putative virion core protein (lumpy skin disease virus) [uncultured Clostridium sp.]